MNVLDSWASFGIIIAVLDLMRQIHDNMFKTSMDVPYFGTMQLEDDREISILKWQFEFLLKTIDEELVLKTTAV